MNLKLLCLLFDPSLTVQQTNTYRGSSTLLKFQSSFYFSTEVCLFSLLLHFQANTDEKIIDDQKLLHSFLDSPLADLQTDFCRESSATVKFYICSCFLAQVWLLCLLQCFDAETGGVNFHIVWNYYIPSWIPHLQSHKRVFVERALPRQSSTTAHVFRLGLTLRPTPVFPCWNWWAKVL